MRESSSMDANSDSKKSTVELLEADISLLPNYRSKHNDDYADEGMMEFDVTELIAS
jgi:hypothetical protein